MSAARGFTLVEIIVSIFIIVVTIGAAAGVALTLQSTTESKQLSVAQDIVGTEIEQLRAGGYSNLPASGSFSSPDLSSLPSSSASTTITAYSSTTKQVTAGVSWTSANGVKRYVSVTTLITQIGGL